MKTTIDLNSSQCIKEALNIGNITYQNICNGTVAHVMWGSMDWILFGLLIMALAAAIVALVMAMFLSVR